jgi:hypothetical protein
MKQLGVHGMVCHDFESLNLLTNDLVQLEIGKGLHYPRQKHISTYKSSKRMLVL